MSQQSVTEGRILDLLAEAVKKEQIPGHSWADVFFHMSAMERLAFDLFLVRTRDPLAYEAGTVEHRFSTRVRRMAGERRCK